MFTNTDVHKIVHISKTSQDNPNLSNSPETKHHHLHFHITNTTGFSFLISGMIFLPVSTNMNYLKNGLDFIYKSLAQQAQNHPANVPTKSDMNCLRSFEVIQISSF